MKNSTRKTNSETVSTVIDSDMASDASVSHEAREMLSEILRKGAQKMLQTAIHREVDDYLQERSNLLDEHGRRLVVRNGSLPERELITGLGSIPVQQPRVRDKRASGEREVFNSSILPKYLRETKSIEELVPWLYLKGISTNDFPEALQSMLGKDAKGLSATTITRLKSIWMSWVDVLGTHYVPCKDRRDRQEHSGESDLFSWICIMRLPVSGWILPRGDLCQSR